MTLQSKMTELADVVRERFGETGKLSIDDMIQLIKLPPFASGTVVASNVDMGFGGIANKRIKFSKVPPAMRVPMQVNISSGNYTMIADATLVFNLANGNKLSLKMPTLNSNSSVSVTIPAGTSLSASDPIMQIQSNNAGGTITQITITY